MDALWLTLPDDTQFSIVARLGPADMARLQCVSKAAAQCTQDDALWHPHQAAARWFSRPPPMHGPVSVQRLYKAMARAEFDLFEALKVRESRLLRSINGRQLVPRGGLAPIGLPVSGMQMHELQINADAQKRVARGLHPLRLPHAPQPTFLGTACTKAWAWATQTQAAPPLDATARHILQQFCVAEGVRMA